MIVTVTLNPSVDIAYQLDKLNMDTVNRCQDYQKTAGGKGINVARVIRQFSPEVLATGFLGGAFGEFIQQELDLKNLTHDFAKIDQPTRSCIAILHDGGHQTEILESGPKISEAERHSFDDKLYQLLQDEVNVLTISGSVPPGIPSTYYSDVIKKANQCAVKVILDCSGESLTYALNNSEKPYAIKPNLEELSAITSITIDNNELEKQIKQILDQPLFSGIPLIVVSLGAEGAIAKYEDTYYRVMIPEISVVNPVGSGDSTVAGLAMTISKSADIEEMLKTAMTLGMLNAMESKTGYVDVDLFDTYYQQIQVQQIH